MTIKNQKHRNKSAYLSSLFIHIKISLLVLLQGMFSTFVHAEEQTTLFVAPASFTAAKPTNSEQTLALLTSDIFHQELFNLAKQLPKEKIEQAAMFNKVALLSVLDNHQQLIALINNHKNGIAFTHYLLHSETLTQLPPNSTKTFAERLSQHLSQKLAKLNNENLYQTNNALGWSVKRAQDYMENIFANLKDKETLTFDEAISLIVNGHLYRVLERVIPTSQRLLAQENAKRYIIEPEILITTPAGVELTATIVRAKNANKPLPTAFQFTIYADEPSHIRTAIHAAAHGYVGVVANSRGKRASSNKITPWVYDGQDATSVIDWISKQPWSNGAVAMYGGSYNGFTQWAAAKYMHPALKAMAPYTAASLITGLPYENNIALTGNYQWAHHVTNNKTMDNSVYANWAESQALIKTLFESGRPLTDIDKLDGKANPFFQQWLQHPSFDSYYQDMVPVKAEYAQINIPVLSVTGYFDGGQISSVDYLKRHYKYNKNADHTLLIGPYNHGTAQGTPSSHHSNYLLDEVALNKDTEEIVFQWFDHLLFNKPKPLLLKDKVNYQLMGSNTWQHRSSFSEMNERATSHYLTSALNEQGHYLLSENQEQMLNNHQQTVDMTDRTQQHNVVPWPVIQQQLNEPNGLIFSTKAFETDQSLAGEITGYFSIAVNKKDVDIGYNFYEIDKDGNVFHLNNYRSRASYAKDMSHRALLTPNKKTIIPIINARMTAKLIKKGSRLVIVLNVNKNLNAQVNMGSGKNVSYETIADAGKPLTLKWFNDSKINLPLTPWSNL